jgi:hypothetical protein
LAVIVLNVIALLEWWSGYYPDDYRRRGMIELRATDRIASSGIADAWDPY